jgi:hypothetical protein
MAFIAGCEYAIFSKVIFLGKTFTERAMFLGSWEIVNWEIFDIGNKYRLLPAG